MWRNKIIRLVTDREIVWQSCRFLTNSEVSTALRPFYFLVHPDLFGKHPPEQVENEKNLKTLKNYVDTLVNKERPNPKNVNFFVLPRSTEKRDKLPTIKLRLVDSNLRSTILAILKGANLPTEFVENITEDDTKDNKVEDIFEDIQVIRAQITDLDSPLQTKVNLFSHG